MLTDGHDAGYDDRSKSQARSSELVFGLDLAELFNRVTLSMRLSAGTGLIKSGDQAGHSRRHLSPSVFEDGEQRVAKGAGTRPDSDPLLDEKGPDLVYHTSRDRTR